MLTTINAQKDEGTNKSEGAKTNNSDIGAENNKSFVNNKNQLNLSLLNPGVKCLSNESSKKEQKSKNKHNQSVLKILQQNKQCSWFSEINFLDW